ncbi:hypothetical protein HanHA300_Chr12g0461051 [Helianthus annuus]|nr:hypothetical protein HanHA300_Chr12g0461051 [Helianthus annuus]KAJ0506820.1 hypothetical protein HanHA89_Chr12g0486451 [Helianthus annuus]
MDLSHLTQWKQLTFFVLFFQFTCHKNWSKIGLIGIQSVSCASMKCIRYIFFSLSRWFKDGRTITRWECLFKMSLNS